MLKFDPVREGRRTQLTGLLPFLDKKFCYCRPAAARPVSSTYIRSISNPAFHSMAATSNRFEALSKEEELDFDDEDLSEENGVLQDCEETGQD